MGKTIIQTIGPLYGEAVNGTVFGRPNGSIFVPPTNNIVISLSESYRYIGVESATTITICDSSGTSRYGAAYNLNFVAESQDLASNVQTQVYSDSECTELVAYNNRPVGAFNTWSRNFTLVAGKSIEDETTYYVRAQLVNNGSPVATSNVIAVEGVVNE